MLKNIIFLLVLVNVTLGLKRISELKCEEYKNLIVKKHSYRICCFGPCPKKINDFECYDIWKTGLITVEMEAKPGEFPHMAAIGYKKYDNTLAFKCSGTLISERFVLTAAHCIADESDRPYLVRLGTVNLDDNGNSSALVDIKLKNRIRHPDYSSIDKTNDIALLELEKSVTFHPRYLRPACLQQTEYVGNNITGTGWGSMTTYGDTSDVLKKLNVPVVDIEKCNIFETGLNGEKQMCAGGERGKGLCQGDSGAPIQAAYLDAPCVHDIVGIFSFGPTHCGIRNHYKTYTKVNYYLDWIEKIVWKDERLERKAELLKAWD